MKRKRNKILRGIPASPGISLERVLLLEGEHSLVMEYGVTDIEKEVEKFKRAVKRTKEEIIAIKDKLEEVTDPYSAKIFDAQLLFLEDRIIIQRIIHNIKRNKRNAEYVFERTVRDMASSLDREKSVFFKDKWGELGDVVSRVIRNIRGKSSAVYEEITEECDIITHYIPASNMALLPRKRVKGIVTEMGGKTSHTSIVARAFGIPAVVGVQDVLKYASDGDFVIVDGTRGIVVINPDESTLKTYEERNRRYTDYMNGLVNLSDISPTTIDGHTIELSANIELPIEIESARNHGARGIGLFRTEFLFMDAIPTEDEQFKVYKYCAEAIKPDSVIIRTVDIGGDKLLQDASLSDANPFLGWRAIRVCMKEKKILETQLRAILRASVYGNIKIMFPLVSAMEEIKFLKGIFKKTQKGLKKEGIRYDERIEVGIMVEVPSAAILAEDFAKEVNFFSIGSNDLTQYTLACDRGNPRVANIFKPLHPAVLRLIKSTVDAGHLQDIWVGLCGELGSETIAIPVLLGLGLDELSVCPASVPEVKSVIRHLTMAECHEIASKVLSMSSAGEVEGYLTSIIKEKFVGIEDILLGM